jgi:exosortase
MSDVSTQSPPPGGAAGNKSLTELAAALEIASAAPALPAAAWAKVLIVGALFVLVNVVNRQFEILYLKYRMDANWSHGFIIPLFSLYLLYVRREEILSAPRRSSAWGLAILLAGLAGSALAVHPIRNNYFSHVCLVVALFGLVAYLAGWKVIRVAWLPVVYLILAMPLPDTTYEKIALPLQRLAAYSSGVLLKLFGTVIQVDSLRLNVVSRSGAHYPPLTVEEACSGIRSMMAFVALAVAWAYITDRPWWQRGLLVLAGLPILVACNILRVTLTATMYVIDQPQFGQKFMHEFMGMALLVPALLLLMLLSKFLSSLFVEVEEDEPAPAPAVEGREEGGP